MSVKVRRMRRLTVTAACAALLAGAAACGASSEATRPADDPPSVTPPASAAAPTAAPEPTSTPAPPPTEAARPTAPAAAPAAGGPSVTIAAVGDVSLAREVVDRMEANGADYPYALIAGLLQADIVIGNLEGALTEGGEPWPKGYNFRTPPRFAIGLRNARFDVVSLANNHAMDYGAAGLADTIGAVEAAGVRQAGGGADAAQAYAPAVIERGGMRVAFVACVLTPTEGGGFAITAWAAGPAAPGLAICSADGLRAQVTDARTRADFVVAIVHAGDEYIRRPNAVQRELAQAALDAGADAYIGHHAHVVQPVEMRGSQLIAWGLGNFIFDLDNVDLANIPEPRVSLILEFTLTKGAGVTSFRAVPVTQDAAEDRPRPATGDEAAILDAQVRGD